MYHFTEVDLNSKSLADLKTAYAQVGCAIAITDKRSKSNWMQAILTHQSAQIEKVTATEIAVTGDEGYAGFVSPVALVGDEGYSGFVSPVAAQIPGYDFCISHGIEFKQRTGETGTPYWYAVAPDYYGKPGRQFKTSCFVKLLDVVKHTINYLGKCGVDVAEPKQRIIDLLKADFPEQGETVALTKFDDRDYAEAYIHEGEAWLDIYKDSCLQSCEKLLVYSANPELNDLAAPIVQSGSLIFKKAASPNPSKTVYEVFRGLDSLGIIVKNESGDWSSSVSESNYATPYEAAAALLKPTTTSLDLPVDEAPEIEVDSDTDPDFGVLYRVWYNYHLLGTFYQAIDGSWIAQPCNSEKRPRFNTAAEAQLLIVATSGLLVAAVGEDVDPLDKPFDELTVDDWKAIKLSAQQAELVAA